MAITYQMRYRVAGTQTWTDYGSPVSTTSGTISGLATNTSYEFAIVASQSGLLATSSTVSAVTSGESVEGTSVTTAGPIIYASQNFGNPAGAVLDQWALTAGGQINKNGVLDPVTGNVRELYYHKHYLWQNASDLSTWQGWWVWTASGWVETKVTGITLSGTTFTGGAADGTIVGAISVVTTGPTFLGTLSLSGTDAARFRISGTNLVTNGVQNQGSYSVTIVANEKGYEGNSLCTINTSTCMPFTAAQTITASAPVVTSNLVPLGAYLGTWINDPGSVYYTSLSTHWTGFVSALGRTPPIFGAAVAADYNQDPSSWPVTSNFSVSNWPSTVPKDNSVTPMCVWAWNNAAGAAIFSDVANGATVSYAGHTVDYWIQQTLLQWKNAGFNKIYIRPAKEFNLNDGNQIVNAGNVATWRAAWQHFYTVCHNWAVANNFSVRIVWNPSCGGGQTSTISCASQLPNQNPGDNYVDVIAADWYSEGSIPANNPDIGPNAWTLARLVALCQQWNLPFGVCELGGITDTQHSTSAAVTWIPGSINYFNTLKTLSPSVPIEFLTLWDVDTSLPATANLEFTSPSAGHSDIVNAWKAGLGTSGSVTTLSGIAVPLGSYCGTAGDTASGSYPGYSGQWDGFTAQVGRAPTIYTVYIDQNYAPNDASFGWPQQGSYEASLMKGDTRTANAIPSAGLPFGYNPSHNIFSALAAGTYDSQIQGYLGAWKSAGFNTMYIRPAWEFNLPQSSGYGVTSANVNSFISAWQHVYTVIRNYAVANGMSLKVVWNPNVGNNQNDTTLTVAQMYPGDAYVDIIAIDTYGSPVDTGHNPLATTTDPTQYLVSTMIAMGKSHGKPIAVPEVGGLDTTFAANFVSAMNNAGTPIEYITIWDNDIPPTHLSWSNASDNQAALCTIWRNGLGPNGSIRTQPSTAVYTPIDGTYALIFDEEFNGSSLDANRWNQLEGNTLNNLLVHRSNISVSNSCARVSVVGSSTSMTGAFFTTSGSSQSFSFNASNGAVYMEGRCKQPLNAKGAWPALWTNFAGNFPEFDLFEFQGNHPTWAYLTYHQDNDNASPPSGTNGTGFSVIPDLGVDMGAAFHVYGMLWTTTDITFYVDGVARRTIHNGSSYTGGWGSTPVTVVFPTASENQYINVQIGANGFDQNNIADGTTVFPMTMLCDYIHVYQKGGTPVTPQANYGGPGSTAGPA